MAATPSSIDLDRSQRFEFVDALRGLAALMVLSFHLMFNSAQTELLQSSAPKAFVELSRYGANGVPIFFVISGFVICYSVRRLPLTFAGAGNFALRRQVRLDPPYYVVIVGVLIIAAAESQVAGLEARSFTIGQVLLNMVYLQDIVGVPAMVAVAWTLCIEVQFYLVLIVVMLATRRWRTSPSTQGGAVRLVVMILAALSLLMPWLGWSTGPWFMGHWWMFALGMSVAWVLLREISMTTGWALLAVTFVNCLAFNLNSPDSLGGYWAAWLTAVVLLLTVRTGAITSKMPRPLLLLGAWTYSLYLVHLLVIDVLMGAMFKITGQSIAGAWLAYGAGIVGSLVAAWVLYTLVERRSVVWAQKLKPSYVREHGARPPAPVTEQAP
ncbi:acyltransferase family protein [Ornithinimicrobium cerasi]|uniref:acyltransferase family protein n=1 Tax=Ornithinimicrobium cerasi TaxID=2248773 RepID=UPI000F00260A|nr:acyltransferase [Ornithinimicrobium cerasi]